MKFQCLNPDCKKVFLYTAKQTSEDPIGNSDPNIYETHVCPFCHGLVFEESDSVPSEKIVSLKSVSIEEVDGLIKEGYEVREVYAKNAILQKKLLIVQEAEKEAKMLNKKQILKRVGWMLEHTATCNKAWFINELETLLVSAVSPEEFRDDFKVPVKKETAK